MSLIEKNIANNQHDKFILEANKKTDALVKLCKTVHPNGSYANKIEQLINEGADVGNLYIDSRFQPLYSACEVGDIEVIRVLLKHGAKIHHDSPQNESNVTALITLALYNSSKPNVHEIAKLLMEYGADPNQENAFGNTVIDHIGHANAELLTVLIENGLDINKPNKYGKQYKDRVETFSFNRTDIFDLAVKIDMIHKQKKINSVDSSPNENQYPRKSRAI